MTYSLHVTYKLYAAGAGYWPSIALGGFAMSQHCHVIGEFCALTRTVKLLQSHGISDSRPASPTA